MFAIAPLLAAYGFALRNQTQGLLGRARVRDDLEGRRRARRDRARRRAVSSTAAHDETNARTKLGIYTFVFAAVWFAIATQVLLPHFSPTGKAFYAEGLLRRPRQQLLERRGVVRDAPEPRRRRTSSNAHTPSYLRNLWAPFGFVNLLAPLTMIIAIPQLLANLLSINNFTWSLRFHYIAIPLAASMLGFVLGLKKLRGNWRTFAVGIALAASVGTALSWGVGPYSANYKAGYWPLHAGRERGADRARAVVDPAARGRRARRTTSSRTSPTGIRSTRSPTRGRAATGGSATSTSATRRTSSG